MTTGIAGNIAGGARDTRRLKSVGGDTEKIQIFKITKEDLEVQEHSTIIETKNVAGNVGIYGHELFGVYGSSRYGIGTSTALVWGSGKWGERLWKSATKSFILGHSVFGQLSLNTLGVTTIEFVRIRVVNPNNTWKEVIRNTNFKDTDNTDATWDVTNHDWEFTNSQVVQTKSIYLNNDTITNATLTIDTNNITDSSVLTFELSADGGTNWEEVTNGTRHNFTNTGDDLRLRITASGASKIHIERGRFFPQTFPIVLDDGSSQPIEVVYNEN